LLRAAGQEVYTPTLTGLGERPHLLPKTMMIKLKKRKVVDFTC